LPQCKKYGSIAFPNFESGLLSMREVAKQVRDKHTCFNLKDLIIQYGEKIYPECMNCSTCKALGANTFGCIDSIIIEVHLESRNVIKKLDSSRS
jgi:hypothetical protein